MAESGNREQRPESMNDSPGSSPATTTIQIHPAQARPKDSYLTWGRPSRHIPFREWYVSTHCTPEHVDEIARIQMNPILDLKLCRLYFRVWSLFADIEFFTYFIPPLMWAGYPYQAMRVVSMLFFTQYMTSWGKDLCGCPRPPCPPLRLGGNSITYNTEYGFPSSHAAHSGVFTYFFFTVMSKKMFPTHPVLCLIFALVYWAHVAFSRILLEMHWKADLIGGWTIAFICILMHTSFINDWEIFIINNGGGVLSYLAVLLWVMVMATIHPVPHDKCPCYFDSMKFVGVMVGCFYGMWACRMTFGTALVRPPTPLIQDTICTWSFLKQFVSCAAIPVLIKEVCGFLSKKPFQLMFKFLAGCYADKIPPAMRRPYITFSRAVGAAVGKPLRSTTSGAVDTEASQQPTADEIDPTGLRSARSSPAPREDPDGRGKNAVAEANLPSAVSSRSGEGFFNGAQQWSLLGHKHWWLWDLYAKCFGYTMLAFSCAYLVPLILRYCFHVHETVPQ